MKTISLNCPNCGGELEVDSDKEFCFCLHCGNKILLDNGKRETVHRIIDEAKLKELENAQKSEESNRIYNENRAKSVFKTKMIMLAIWAAIVVVLLVLSICTADDVGFSPYQLLLFPVFISGLVIIIKKIKKFFRNN